MQKNVYQIKVIGVRKRSEAMFFYLLNLKFMQGKKILKMHAEKI